ncbi:hypothetical protein A2757_03205 [Candidatus Giovannonibacteria bacterium RIFCSPHIGHO2_01_FULL_48_47]|nr:MAG: hypothetical protein A2757_03205 [Candidatus Giovannonibacteria bacterium RIFCSPHIGHO2_01_FULL_48_47]OGF68772.1 MAG: hypothetical protein A3D61_01655 [Candidatus Giovannonibacteria bacterium RIFCSPHIGHO2_02_FULL_48_15]OGF88564.1 MAG: hypothetical protein A3B26_02270 [Candidatus Giovannonibacteria bacterium RIFCSPLOWO2_01_FULL_48_47]OGF94973.1 MAG: hypothetical protein A2433_03040 [Candidatus Giovannonibacteria bacterium RIFOXYC1_FULL_48_8]OGF96293.1 MAG: hypothetical protein A2613_01885
MKYPAEIYAQALFEALEEDGGKEESKALKRFSALLEKNNDADNFEKILRAFEKIIVEKSGGKFVTLEFSRPVDENLVKKLSSIFSKKDFVEFRERPELLAGVRILIDGEKELDFSFQGRLNKLFS